MSKARDLANAGTALTTVDATELGYLDGVTSAIQTQLDAKTAKSTLTTTGDIYYASAANTPARLGIGTASQLLAVNSGATAPEWVAAPSSGGMTVLASGSMSGASVSLTSISTSYNDLRLVIRDYLPSVDGGSLRMRVNNLSGSNYTDLSTLTNRVNIGFGNAEFASIADNNNLTSDSLISIEFLDYANTTTWKTMIANVLTNYSLTSTNANIQRKNAAVNTTSAITQIEFYPFSGTFTGTYILYGVK